MAHFVAKFSIVSGKGNLATKNPDGTKTLQTRGCSVSPVEQTHLALVEDVLPVIEFNH